MELLVKFCRTSKSQQEPRNTDDPYAVAVVNVELLLGMYLDNFVTHFFKDGAGDRTRVPPVEKQHDVQHVWFVSPTCCALDADKI